jgi:hypothetical protein
VTLCVRLAWFVLDEPAPDAWLMIREGGAFAQRLPMGTVKECTWPVLDSCGELDYPIN